MKILMVCFGNICRSPLAEGILKNKVEKAGLDWEIDSAGTLGSNIGSPPHHYSQLVAKKHNIDISASKCRFFSKNDLTTFDKIYVMDDENYLDVKELSAEKWDPEKVDLILNELHPGKNETVPDPWFGGEKDFFSVYNLLDEACDAILQKYVITHPAIATTSN